MKRFLALALLCLCSSAWAIPPVLAPYNHVVSSPNGQFKACVNARREVITIKHARKWWPDAKLWSVKRYLEHFDVSDNGRFLYTSSYVGDISKTMQEEIIWVDRSDGLQIAITVGQIVRSKSSLKKSEGMGGVRYDWGYTRGTDGDWLLVKTYEDRNLRINVWTGEVRPAPQAEAALSARKTR